MNSEIKGIIFDLDGVIVFTDELHYEAWKTMADEMEVYFDKEINNLLRGVSRMESLEIILRKYYGKPLSDEEKSALADKKNNIYKKLLEKMQPTDVADSVRNTLKELKEKSTEELIGKLLEIQMPNKSSKQTEEKIFKILAERNIIDYDTMKKECEKLLLW